ncbi:MAG: gluconokinase [Paracoccaceae bacterium]
MLRVVLMGVSGCGKSSVGEALSELLAVPYVDGDDLHPAANVAKMAAGIALNDNDRWPWLDRVADVLSDSAPVIVGCSALKHIYRDHIRARAGGRVRFVHLAGSRDQIAARIAQRDSHYMPLSLLESQFATLEAPGSDEAQTVDIAHPTKVLAEMIAASLRNTGD